MIPIITLVYNEADTVCVGVYVYMCVCNTKKVTNEPGRMYVCVCVCVCVIDCAAWCIPSVERAASVAVTHAVTRWGGSRAGRGRCVARSVGRSHHVENRLG